MSPVLVALLGLAFAALLSASSLSQVNWNPTLFVGFGEEARWRHERSPKQTGMRPFLLPLAKRLWRLASLEVVDVGDVNKLGTFGWRLHHAIGAGRISASEARVFDLLVPVVATLGPLLLVQDSASSSLPGFPEDGT